MASAKKKKKKRNLFLLSVAIVFIGALVFSVNYLVVSSTNGSLPPFEEGLQTSGEVGNVVNLIDRCISKFFYNLGIAQKNIIFVSVVPMHKGGYIWEFNNIKVKIPADFSISGIAREFEKAVSAVNKALDIEAEKRSAEEVIYNIYYNDFYIYTIRLVSKEAEYVRDAARPEVAIIIDDLGYDSALANAFISLDLPLTFSLLPFAPQARSIAGRARNKGRETMLHLPMEPISYPATNPGDGVLLLSMDRKAIMEVLVNDLDRVPSVSGVNNHMGSRFTENREKMRIVLGELKRRGLYFIDSRTSANTVAYKLALEMSVRAGRRDVFLDNELSRDGLETQMERLINLAKHDGRAIGIAHPHKETLELLKRHLMDFQNDIRIVSVSKLLN